MKKIAPVSLSVALAFCALPSVALADSEIELGIGGDASESIAAYSEDGASASGIFNSKRKYGTWSFSDGTLTVSGFLQKFDGRGNIPNEITSATKRLVFSDDVDTNSISYNVFKPVLDTVEEIVLPSTVTELPALGSAPNLSKLSFPNGCGIVKLSPQAFKGNQSFRTLDLSEMGITEIEDKSVFAQSNIEEIVFPKTLTTLGDYAFVQMGELRSMDIPDTVTSIGNRAFQLCWKLEHVSIPSSVTSLGGSLFDTSDKNVAAEVLVYGANDLSEGLAASKKINPSCTIKLQQLFDGNYDGAESIDAQWVEFDSCLGSADDAPSPTRDGYTFTGWYSDAECATPYDFTAPMEHGVVAYAGWKQIVSVDVNYGNGSENGTITADENGMIAKPDADPIRAGYKFAGWFSDETCTAEFDFTQPVADGACLYAGWVPVKASVSNVDGTKTELQVKADGTIAEPMAPARDGYVFKGWYSDPYCTQAFDFGKPLYDDVTLYSKWEAKASEPTTPGGSTNAGDTGSGSNAQQAGSTNNAGVQTLAQTGDAAAGAVPAVAFASAMAAAVVAFARKRIARR